MVYALLIASNTGNEILGFSLLLISALLFTAWGFLDKYWAFLALQSRPIEMELNTLQNRLSISVEADFDGMYLSLQFFLRRVKESSSPSTKPL